MKKAKKIMSMLLTVVMLMMAMNLTLPVSAEATVENVALGKTVKLYATGVNPSGEAFPGNGTELSYITDGITDQSELLRGYDHYADANYNTDGNLYIIVDLGAAYDVTSAFYGYKHILVAFKGISAFTHRRQTLYI